MASTSLSPDRRLAAARRLAEHLASVLRADFALRLWDGTTVPLGPEARTDLALAVHSPAAITRLLRRPRLTTVVELAAAGELDIEGGTLLDLAARRGAATRGLARRLDKRLLVRSLLPFLFARTGVRGAGHAFAGKQRARADAGRDDTAQVQFHYDLSNDFYELFLDPEMASTCAYFTDWDASLEEAQHGKLDMICRKLRLAPGERLLDIGCGWGGLICHAAQHYGVRAHGVTLSQAQYDFARRRSRALAWRIG